MRLVNEFRIRGRLGADPELKTSAGGKKYMNFSVAVQRMPYKDKEGKEIKPDPDWMRVTLFDKTAEFFVKQDPKKGDIVEIEGSLSENKRKDEETGKNFSSIALIGWKIGNLSNDFRRMNKAKTSEPDFERDYPVKNKDDDGFNPADDFVAPHSSTGGASGEDDDIPF